MSRWGDSFTHSKGLARSTRLRSGHDSVAPGLDPLQHTLEGFQSVGFPGRLVPAQAVDAGKAHGEARLVPRGALQSLEGDFEHQARIGFVRPLAHPAEAVDGGAPHVAGALYQLLVGE